MTRRWHPPPAPPNPPAVVISERQADVLAGITVGLTNWQISRRLNVTEDTVKCHVRAVLAALNARNRAHAAVLACTGAVDIHVHDNERGAA